jgi:hypothetical protein
LDAKFIRALRQINPDCRISGKQPVPAASPSCRLIDGNPDAMQPGAGPDDEFVFYVASHGVLVDGE